MIYDIVQQLNFKTTICNHYHGDYGTLYSTFADNGRTIWQCACGYRTVTNGVVNFSLKEFLDSSESDKSSI